MHSVMASIIARHPAATYLRQVKQHRVHYAWQTTSIDACDIGVRFGLNGRDYVIVGVKPNANSRTKNCVVACDELSGAIKTFDIFEVVERMPRKSKAA